MRRGLISWSREELPIAVFEDRVARLQTAMRAEDLDVVLAYASFAQPAPVQWLSNFLPYWGDAMLAIFADGPPLLLTSLTKRVHPWIHAVCHTGGVVSAPRLGENVEALLSKRVPAGRRIGVICLDTLPWPVATALNKAGRGAALVDVSNMYAALRQPADAAEIKLAEHAAAIGRAALQAIPAEALRTTEVIAALESSARLAGAEEVLQRIAPDLSRSATLLRMEGDAPLGERYAVELSVAYKGAWVRVTRCIATPAASASQDAWNNAQRWFTHAATSLNQSGQIQSPNGAPGKLLGWTVEASVGAHPLEVIAADDLRQSIALPAGSLAVFCARLELDDGPWRASTPLIIAPAGSPSALIGP